MRYLGYVPKCLILFVLTAALSVSAAASAHAYLYLGEWSAFGEKPTRGIARLDLNGKGLLAGYVSNPYPHGNVGAVAVNKQYIFFSGSQGVIGRADLNGGNVEPDLFNIPQPLQDGMPAPFELDADHLVATGRYVYWSTGDGPIAIDQTNNAVWRAEVDGRDVEPSFIQTESPVRSLAVADDHIYWATNDSIARASLDGTNVDEYFIPLTEPAAGLAVVDNSIYWGSSKCHCIGRASIDGHDVDSQFMTNLGFVTGVVTGGGYIYWTAKEWPEEKVSRLRETAWMGRADLDGAHIEKHLLNVTNKISGITADGLGPGANNGKSFRSRKHRRARRRPR